MQQAPRHLPTLFRSGCTLAFGAAWTLFSSIFLLIAWTSGAPWYFLLFALPFLAVGVGMVSYGLWGLVLKPGLIARYFGPALTSVSPQQLRVGERVSVRFEQPVRREVEISRVVMQLVLRETAQYRRGSNTHTATHNNVIDQVQSPGRRLKAGESIVEQCTLTVPQDGMHSFTASRNRLTWLVRIIVESPAAPDASEEIGIVVTPEIVAEESRGRPV